MLSLGDIKSIRRFVMISCHDVVDIVHTSGSKSDFEEICGPNTSVSILCLILGVVRRVDVIVDVSISFVPLLIIVLLEMLVGRVDGEVLTNPSCKLKLLVDFFEKQIILLSDHAVTVSAVSGENLET